MSHQRLSEVGTSTDLAPAKLTFSFATLRTALGSTIARNAAALYLIQFANYVVPLIMVPYLVRVLGPAGYGAVAFAQGFINYLILFVEYGFDWSATRRISVLRDDPEAVNWIAVHVWAAKALLSLMGLGVLGLLILTVPQLGEVALLLLALYGLVLGNVLFPTWLFQGMERMVAISLINLGMKLGVLAGVFLLVRQPEDAWLYAGLLGGGSVLAGLVGAGVGMRMFGIRPKSVSLRGVWEVLREGWTLFLSKASVSLYTAGNTFILGMLTNHTVVGYYSAAEKIVKSVLGLLGPISQAAYPRFSKMASESRDKALFWMRKMLLLIGGLGSIMTIILFLAAPLIGMIILGHQFQRSIAVVHILSPLVFLIGVNNTLGIQVLFPFNQERWVAIIVFVAGLINIVLAALLAPRFAEQGMAVAVLLAELFVTVAYYLVVEITVIRGRYEKH